MLKNGLCSSKLEQVCPNSYQRKYCSFQCFTINSQKGRAPLNFLILRAHGHLSSGQIFYLVSLVRSAHDSGSAGKLKAPCFAPVLAKKSSLSAPSPASSPFSRSYVSEAFLKHQSSSDISLKVLYFLDHVLLKSLYWNNIKQINLLSSCSVCAAKRIFRLDIFLCS